MVPKTKAAIVIKVIASIMFFFGFPLRLVAPLFILFNYYANLAFVYFVLKFRAFLTLVFARLYNRAMSSFCERSLQWLV